MHDDLKLLLSLEKELLSGEEPPVTLQRMMATYARFGERPLDQQLQILAALHGDLAEIERRVREETELFSLARKWVSGYEQIVRQNGGEAGTRIDEAAGIQERIRAASDATAAIEVLFSSQRQRVWRPMDVTEALTQAGRRATKGMVETALVRGVRRGVFSRPAGKRGGYCLAEPEEVVFET